MSQGMGMRGAALAAAVVGAFGPLQAQDLPRPADVTTLDGIIGAYYEVVSGPAGSVPDRARDESLHHPDALVAIAGRDQQGAVTLTTMTLGGYHDRFGGPRQAGFFEWETAREVRTFGTVTHVWSSYASSEEPDGPATGRGVNSIQLHHDGSRWWILGWVFDGGADFDEEHAADEADVLAAVQEFFDAMEAADVARSRAVLAPGARFFSVREQNGRRATGSFSTEEHLERLPTSGRLLERMWHPRVELHGDVASVWAPYDFHRDGAFSHCGVDALTLLRGDGGWVITGATYTVETADCPPSPLGPPGD